MLSRRLWWDSDQVRIDSTRIATITIDVQRTMLSTHSSFQDIMMKQSVDIEFEQLFFRVVSYDCFPMLKYSYFQVID
jgi:hypothetical protein